MGEVWLAEQSEPVKRRVALKVIKRGMDSKAVIARFESERQALALMDHPAIARVFDAGTTPGGRPYFAMEHVQGEPITTYCDRQRMVNEARLDLFRQVCAGVQHAHQKGIIHRDLKPSNVLVKVQDGRPVPKIIDFGVAKATAQRLTEHTVYTELGLLIGTPEYMSPEQAEMTALDVDTRTDVYALGVMLYELLTGALPFDFAILRKAGYDELRRKIREDDPPRPSTRWGSLPHRETAAAARARATEPAVLRRDLAGDLDWIVMRAIEKDRTRRYGSPNELSADLARHLRHDPVEASPPSASYRARKFARRNRVAVSFAAVVLALLLGFAVTMALQARRIAAERDRANREATTAREVADFLVGLFEVSDPGKARGNSITAREILDRGADRISRDLESQPLTQARLLEVVGDVYSALGLYQEGGPLLQRAIDLKEKVLGSRDPELARALNRLGWLYMNEGRLEPAISLHQRALDIFGSAVPSPSRDLAWTRYYLGSGAARKGDFGHATQLLEKALADFESIEPMSLGVAWCLNDLGIIQALQGRHEAAIPLVERGLEIKKAVLGEDHHDVATSLNSLFLLYANSEQFDKAEELQGRALSLLERNLGPDHPGLTPTLDAMASVALEAGRLDEARRLWERALAILGDSENKESLGYVLHGLARVAHREGRVEDAEDLLVRARAVQGEYLTPDHPQQLATLESHARLLRDLGRVSEAADLEALIAAARSVDP